MNKTQSNNIKNKGNQSKVYQLGYECYIDHLLSHIKNYAIDLNRELYFLCEELSIDTPNYDSSSNQNSNSQSNNKILNLAKQLAKATKHDDLFQETNKTEKILSVVEKLSQENLERYDVMEREGDLYNYA